METYANLGRVIADGLGLSDNFAGGACESYMSADVSECGRSGAGSCYARVIAQRAQYE